MNALHPLAGHEERRAAILRSFLSGRLPPTLLLHGPPGVGKQRFALWVGQLILCEAPTADGPCNVCRGCRMALGLQHPDLIWYFPLERPRARSSREKEEEAFEEARHAALDQIRSAPLRPSWSELIRGIHFPMIRNLRKEAARRPAVGPRRLFLIADAEELVAQDSSAAAANALLKTLEEPPADTWFILTSSEPGRILSTIRSRSTAVHLAPLRGDQVQAFLAGHTDAGPDAIDKSVALSGGSIGRALGFLPDGDSDGPLDTLRRDAFRLLRAAIERRSADRYALALAQKASGGRGLHELLVALEGWIRDLAVIAAWPEAPVLNVDARSWLLDTVRTHAIHPDLAAASLEHVESARAAAAGNANPQLLIGNLLGELNRALVGRTGPPREPEPLMTS